MDKIVINYHITEKCNYSCKYCFAKYGLGDKYYSELHHSLNYVESLFKQIYDYFSKNSSTGVVRLNIAGGEPLLLKSFSALINIFNEVGFELSLITNGSLLTDKFIKKYALNFSTVGISIDSFVEETNIDIGRISRTDKSVDTGRILKTIELLRNVNPETTIKINTVVSSHNCTEEMHEKINEIMPEKWKIFEELTFGIQSDGCGNQAFMNFVKNNIEKVRCPVFVEDNEAMTNSYLMIDPLGRFYQNTGINGSYIYSDPILEIGVANALEQITFDRTKFEYRYMSISKNITSQRVASEKNNTTWT